MNLLDGSCINASILICLVFCGVVCLQSLSERKPKTLKEKVCLIFSFHSSQFFLVSCLPPA